MASNKRKQKKTTLLGGKSSGNWKCMNGVCGYWASGGAQGSYDDILMWAAALAIVLLLAHKFIGDDPTIRILKRGRILDSRWLSNLGVSGGPLGGRNMCSGKFPVDFAAAVGDVSCAARGRSAWGIATHALFVLGFGGSAFELGKAVYEKLK